MHPAPATSPAPAVPLPWRQVALITAGAVALFAGFRFLPTGTNLSHMDFRVSGGSAIEFCDPSNPQFLPVVDMRSPVTMALRTDAAPVPGQKVSLAVTLRTGSGKAIEPVDLLVSHTRLLHLLVVDPTLGDYQHVHPVPAGTPGEWRVEFTPRLAGKYRIFADFTPAATGRGLYASADLVVAGPPANPAGARPEGDAWRFELTPVAPIRAGVPADLRLSVTAAAGGNVPLEPVMGAFAHLVAFDGPRSGFAHLHPMETDLLAPPDAQRPQLNFKVTIPDPGRYVIWAQVNLAGTEVFRAFEIEVGR
jgi:hypothetical protein